MTSFKRQLQRASQRQELELVEQTVRALHDDNQRLQAENRSLYRAVGALVAVAGGEVRLPKDMSELLKGKHLTTEEDKDADEIVFRIVDAAAAEKDATNE
jgi:hypothetical protein